MRPDALTTVVVGDPDTVVPQFAASGMAVEILPDDVDGGSASVWEMHAAARFHAHGGPEVLALEDAPDPRPRPGTSLVRVRACALNHLDLWQRRGLERVTIPFPHISGADVAGEVVDAPGGEVAAGTRVLLQPGLSCGRCAACLDGRDNSARRYDVLGYQSDGGYAELVRGAGRPTSCRFPITSRSSTLRRFRSRSSPPGTCW